MALAGMALVGAPTCTLTDCGSIPGQGTCLDGQFDPQWVCREAVSRCFSLTSTFLSLFLPSSLSKINKHIFKNKKKGSMVSRVEIPGLWVLGPKGLLQPAPRTVGHQAFLVCTG